MQKSEKAPQHPDPAMLLAWYDANGRTLPWRHRPGTRTPDGSARHAIDPYKVWLSEIMLQQTTVAAVQPYYEKFLDKWPTVVDLAMAPLDDILAAWAGLGYYARARNMHKCAILIMREKNGRFPETEADLLALPGVGPYTAAAIAAIAFDLPATIMDGNVERVIARHFAVEELLPRAKPSLRALAEAITPTERPGDYAQAIMDLGATICTPRTPSCLICPWQSTCQGRLSDPLGYPKKAPKAPKPTRYGHVFWHETITSHVLLERRPESGLLGGMLGFPGSSWSQTRPDLPTTGTPIPGVIRHTFTHFHLELTVLYCHPDTPPLPLTTKTGGNDVFIPRQDILTSGLPTVMRKVAQHTMDYLSSSDHPSIE